MVSLRYYLLSAAAALGLATASAPAHAAPEMSFRLAPTGHLAKCRNRCPKVIIAEGEIGRATPRKFTQFIRTHMREPMLRAVVFVHSPGGLVVASMQLGKLFRKLGAAVVVARVVQPHDGRGRTVFVPGRCYSACVYALMGAKKRVVPPQSRLVVHRMFIYELLGDSNGGQATRQKTYRNDKLYADLTRYARMMGVSRSVVDVAENTPPGEVRVISQREIRRWRLGVPRL